MLVAELNRVRRIGCEYEMTVPLVGNGGGMDVQQTLATVLSANGIRAIARGYSHAPIDGVDIAVEYDSSVRGESRWQGIRWFPIEVKSRILNGFDDWEQVIPKALEICRYMGARVNASTGHHIHLAFEEVRHEPRTVRSLWNIFHRFEPVIFGLVAPSRRGNSYCKPLPTSAGKLLNGANTLRSLRRALAPYDRYHGLNLTHLFEDSPHIELRYHHGTLDAAKARHWLRFCLQLLQHACNRRCQATDEPAANDRRGIEALLTVCGFKVNTKVYAKVGPELRETGKHLLRTWKRFNGAHPLHDLKAMPQEAE